MKTTANTLRGVILGVLSPLLLTLVLAAVAAACVGGGMLPAGAIPAIAYAITVLASLLGAMICGKQAGKSRLPICLGSCCIYLLLIFVLRGLIYHSVSSQPWIIPVCALAGCVLGALLSSRKKRRRY